MVDIILRISNKSSMNKLDQSFLSINQNRMIEKMESDIIIINSLAKIIWDF